MSRGKLKTKPDLEVATKHDGGKVSLALFPVRAYVETCKVLDFGALKYEIGNWTKGDGFDSLRLGSAALRHIFSWILGEEKDKQSGLHPLAHAMCMLAFLLEQELHRGPSNRQRSQLLKTPEDYEALMSLPKDLKELAEASRKGK